MSNPVEKFKSLLNEKGIEALKDCKIRIETCRWGNHHYHMITIQEDTEGREDKRGMNDWIMDKFIEASRSEEFKNMPDSTQSFSKIF